MNDMLSAADGKRDAFSAGNCRGHHFRRLRFEVDQLFEDFGPPRSFFDASGLASSLPAIDLAQSEEVYRLSAGMPGIHRSEVEVTLVGHVLSIEGGRHIEPSQPDQPSPVPSFHRRLRIPDDVDVDKVSAGLRNGHLTIFLPRFAGGAPKSRRLEIGIF